MRKYINGTPTVVIDNGKIYKENLKKAKLDLSELMLMCRQEGYFDMTDIQTAIFEYNGKLSVLPVSTKRPSTPEDLGVKVEQASICSEVIMDGCILGENLRRMGLDESWLKKQLHAQGYGNAKDVFLGVCDKSNRLTVFTAG